MGLEGGGAFFLPSTPKTRILRGGYCQPSTKAIHAFLLDGATNALTEKEGVDHGNPCMLLPFALSPPGQNTTIYPGVLHSL